MVVVEDEDEGSGDEDVDDVSEGNDTAVGISDDSSDQNDLNECIEVIVEIIRKLFGNTAVVEEDNSRLVNVDKLKDEASDISWTVSVHPHSLPILEVVSSIVTTVQNCTCASIATDKLLSGNTIRRISDKVRYTM